LDQVRDRIRRKHYSIRTEQAYVDWIRRFVLHHNKRHPRDMGAVEVEAFLTHLAVARSVSASTQNQAKSAISFLYKEVLKEPLPWLDGIASAKRPVRLPVVLTRQEVESIFAHLSGTVGLMIRLLYGTGMRIMECVRLRVKDVDFARGEIVVRQGKGGKDRMTVLPLSLAAPAARDARGRAAGGRLPAVRLACVGWVTAQTARLIHPVIALSSPLLADYAGLFRRQGMNAGSRCLDGPPQVPLQLIS